MQALQKIQIVNSVVVLVVVPRVCFYVAFVSSMYLRLPVQYLFGIPTRNPRPKQ